MWDCKVADEKKKKNLILPVRMVLPFLKYQKLGSELTLRTMAPRNA